MKYFKVIKENFLWDVGCILETISDGGGYRPIDDIYKKHEGNEYITSHIVENSPEYFQRVFKVDLLTRTVYKIKTEAQALLQKEYKSE